MKVTIEEQKLYDDFTASVFQRGYEKGKADATISYQNAYNEGHVDGYAKGVDDRDSDIKSSYMNGYNKGLNDAWECARKIMLCEAKGGFSTDKYTEIFGNISTFQVLEILSASEAIFAIKEYEDKQKAPSEATICSILEDDCPYDIKCEECEVHCSFERAEQKLKEIRNEK